MKIPRFTVHLELEFDTAALQPDPWWLPWGFLIRRREMDEDGTVHNVGPIEGVRVALLGFHLCIALHVYDDHA